mgnify:CR=1 FL=1
MRTPEQELLELEQQALRRSLRQVGSCQSRTISLNGNEVLNFGSNDYLGLANHPALIAAMAEGAEQWGVGSGASRLITGSMTPHVLLEEFIAEYKGCEAALCFANGYATSVGTLTALMGKEDTIILDKLSHASLIDGARMSGATVRVFPHNNMEKLEKLLISTREKSCSDARILIVTESVFSMDGNLAELEKIIALKEKYGALLLLDEAHGLGVYGYTGAGLTEHLACGDKVDIHMGTLGKAAGVAGGYIASNRALIDLVINKARSFIYSTAPPPAQAHTALAALRIIASGEGTQRRETLWTNIAHLAKKLDLTTPQSAIIPWHVGESESALQLSNSLLEKGMFAPAIRFPTVPRNTARLRITLTASHTAADIDTLASELDS